ncbi:PREDICTED: RING-H2 finger protein ATL7-like [Nelumbo nucifera]|uniref:RING-type E3 ubiquitin transferase n=2 Tax=Nelumbo nucifera TaxID=4432 RepID=A0A822YXT2_NELNU|nr:PREDICTED: RING-H2 finger protein ATL7-like [Nelumbo nucifera]DAD38884.1 TPA_asm: hypothetical protein HUJ06_013206 [Nelumbo nucifera]
MSHSYPDPPSCCSTASAELKLYQAFIFSVPIFFTFILLFLFYLFYLRRRRVDWTSLRMRTSYQERGAITRSCESGLTKELREMLPIIIFRESFSVRDTQCSVCLGDYQAEDRLQQLPACGHTFHMECIDHWLAIHTTCPLCRLSLLPAAKTGTNPSDSNGEMQANEAQTDQGFPEDGRSGQGGAEGGRRGENREHSGSSSEDDLSGNRREHEECEFSNEESIVLVIETHGSVEHTAMTNHP